MTVLNPLPAEPLLTVEEARSRILAACTPLQPERLPLTSLAFAVPPVRLAKTLHARRALPPFANSAMDGYGVRAVDVADASPSSPVALRIVGRSLAGRALGATGIGAQMAVEITTGAPIPGGVDAIVMRERCDESSVPNDVVRVREPVAVGENIRPRGEDVDEGAVVGQRGDLLSPARLNLLLSAGHVVVDVVRRPTIAILASGDELREVGEGAGDDVIVNSNAWAIAAAATAAGARVRMLGIAADTLADHVARMDVDDVDVLLTIGGASVGSHDFVRPALAALGGDLALWRIAMRPGKPLAFGSLPSRRRPVLFFGLPGNPVSALVTFTLFVVPALRALQGDPSPTPAPLRLPLLDAAPFAKKKGLAFFARARVVERDGQAGVVTHDRQGSGQISGLAEASCLVAIPADVDAVAPGTLVDVLALDGTSASAFAPVVPASPAAAAAEPEAPAPAASEAPTPAAEPSSSNRRNHERVRVRLDVRVEAGARNLRTSTENVSLGGMFLHGAHDLCRAGETIEIVVHLPANDAEELHVLRGTVVQLVAGRGVGVRFDWHQSMQRAREALVRFFERTAVLGVDDTGALQAEVIASPGDGRG
jgi:molybdopterin molybdotransferase